MRTDLETTWRAAGLSWARGGETAELLHRQLSAPSPDYLHLAVPTRGHFPIRGR